MEELTSKMVDFKGVVNVLKLIGLIAVALIGVMLALVLVLILAGIMNDTVVPALNLGNSTTGNITAVINTVFSFVTQLNTGLQILAALILIVIVVAIFIGLGFLGKKYFGNKGGDGGANF